MPARSLGEGCSGRSKSAKLVDTTTCIGCKACEIACQEWNDLPFATTSFDNTYQTMPHTEWNFWNLIKFNEQPKADGGMMWLMRKDQCMHCAEPGCLAACPADSAIVQYANGIVDFQQDHCTVAATALPDVPSTFPSSIPRRKKSTSARCVRTASPRVWNPPASKPVRPAASTSAPRTT